MEFLRYTADLRNSAVFKVPTVFRKYHTRRSNIYFLATSMKWKGTVLNDFFVIHILTLLSPLLQCSEKEGKVINFAHERCPLYFLVDKIQSVSLKLFIQ